MARLNLLLAVLAASATSAMPITQVSARKQLISLPPPSRGVIINAEVGQDKTELHNGRPVFGSTEKFSNQDSYLDTHFGGSETQSDSEITLAQQYSNDFSLESQSDSDLRLEPQYDRDFDLETFLETTPPPRQRAAKRAARRRRRLRNHKPETAEERAVRMLAAHRPRRRNICWEFPNDYFDIGYWTSTAGTGCPEGYPPSGDKEPLGPLLSPDGVPEQQWKKIADRVGVQKGHVFLDGGSGEGPIPGKDGIGTFQITKDGGWVVPATGDVAHIGADPSGRWLPEKGKHEPYVDIWEDPDAVVSGGIAPNEIISGTAKPRKGGAQ